MGQPSVDLTIAFERPTQFAMQDAQTALSEMFLLSPEDYPEVRTLSKSDVQPPLRELLQCSCGLARHLMQEGGIPAFTPEVIQRIVTPEDDPSRVQVQLRIAAIDQLQREKLAAAYYFAFNIIWLFTNPELDLKDVKTAADALQDQYIKPLRSTLNRGLSTKPLLKEAFQRGIPITHLGGGYFQLGIGECARVISKSATDRDAALGANIASQKDFAQGLLQGIGAPVADAILAKDSDAAVEAAQRLGFPVVVKPADLERSQGVFLDLDTEDSVRHAFDAVRELSSRILVQRRIPGHCHRLVTFQGRFVFGYTRHPAGVEGDGEKTVRDLVQAFNDAHYRKARHLQTKPIPFDDEALACLRNQGVGPDDIPEKGGVVFLRDANLMDFAAYNEIVTDKVHPENIAMVERVSRFFRLESAGIDLISTDPARPWYQTGGAITELNFQPQIGENTARENLAAMFPEKASATIPIECFVGGKAAMRAGTRRLAALAAQDANVVLTSHDTTLNSEGKAHHLAGINGLFSRCSALLRDPQVSVLVVVVQTDEFLRSGPPFNGKVAVTRIDSGVCSHTNPSNRVHENVVQRLLDVLKGN